MREERRGKKKGVKGSWSQEEELSTKTKESWVGNREAELLEDRWRLKGVKTLSLSFWVC